VDFFPPWLGSQYPFILNNKLGRPKGKINDHQFLGSVLLAFGFLPFQNGEKICFFCFVF